jgi:hypothetical protein
MQEMFRSFAILSAALWLIAPNARGASVPNQAAMIFLPPGAAYCRDFLRLEPMHKYDGGTLPLREDEAEDYFTYRGIEEWVRGFVTAANILGAKNNGSGDATKGKDLYELMPQLFEYCRSHRNDIFSAAVLQLLSGPHTSANR